MNHGVAGSIRCRRRSRRGFNLIELLMALAISAALLAATMTALNACFIAYQSTTEEASTHTVARLIMHRVLTMVRTGTDFGPLPDDPIDVLSSGDEVQFVNTSGQSMTLTFNDIEKTLLLQVDDETPRILLRGVDRTLGEDGDPIPAFTMEWEMGTHLRRLTMDLTISGDTSQVTKSDLGLVKPIRLVASSTPRTEDW